MLASSRTLLFTFVFALTLLIAFAPQSVDASANAAVVHRRQANRMIKKRQIGEIIGVGEDPKETGSAGGSATGTGSASGSAPGVTTITTPPATTTTGTTTTTGPSTTSTTSSTSTETSSSTTSTSSSTSSSTTSTSSSTSSTSSTESTSSTSTTSDTLSVTEAPDVALTSSSERPTFTVTNTASAAQNSASESAAPQSASSSSVSRTTITIIAAVGGCIGAAVIIWTIIRKWKFRPSAEFEDRMQPIDWSPDSHESGLGRTVSNSSSFHSGSDHGDGLVGPRTYNPRGNAGLVADLPNHDFTAGPANIGGGYADLQRGPSPGPQMSSVARGPSFNRGYGY